MSRFDPGRWIDLREVWGGRTWELRRGIVVHDEPEVVAVFTPASTIVWVAVDSADGPRLRLPPPVWHLREASSPPDRHFLAIHPPGANHSVLVIWDGDWQPLNWYINLESDLLRTETGFEYEDRILDVIVECDMSSWRWKDEDELAEAVECGLVTPERAAAFRAEGELAIEWLLARRPPYDRDWLDWRPPPEWLEQRNTV